MTRLFDNSNSNSCVCVYTRRPRDYLNSHSNSQVCVVTINCNVFRGHPVFVRLPNVVLCTSVYLIIMTSCKYVLRDRQQPCGLYRALAARTIADYLEEPRLSSSSALVVVDGQELTEGIYAVERLVHCRKRKVLVSLLHLSISPVCFTERPPVPGTMGGIHERGSLLGG
jgi:hypothetical protein